MFYAEEGILHAVDKAILRSVDVLQERRQQQQQAAWDGLDESSSTDDGAAGGGFAAAGGSSEREQDISFDLLVSKFGAGSVASLTSTDSQSPMARSPNVSPLSSAANTPDASPGTTAKFAPGRRVSSSSGKQRSGMSSNRSSNSSLGANINLEAINVRGTSRWVFS